MSNKKAGDKAAGAMKIRLSSQQGEAADDAVKGVLKYIFYRHEFAKRNNEVVDASKKLLEKHFPETNKARNHNSLFYNNETMPPIVLTDLMVNEMYTKNKTQSNNRKDALCEFLKKWRVFPVPAPDKPFMPFPDNISENQGESYQITKPQLPIGHLYLCLCKIQEFETYAVTIMGLKEPIFSPFVTLPDDFRLQPRTIANLKSKPCSTFGVVAIDWNQAIESLSEYFTAWLSVQRAITLADNIRQKSTIDKFKPKRIRIGNKYDQYLAALDYYKSKVDDKKIERGDMAKMALKFCSKDYKYYAPNANEKNLYDSKLSWFTKSVDKGKEWSNNFQLIV